MEVMLKYADVNDLAGINIPTKLRSDNSIVHILYVGSPEILR